MHFYHQRSWKESVFTNGSKVDHLFNSIVMPKIIYGVPVQYMELASPIKQKCKTFMRCFYETVYNS